MSSINSLEEVRRLILDIPDFPKKGINFKDITPVLANHEAFRLVTDSFAKLVPAGVTKILAPESRGFIFGAALVQFTKNAGLVLVRKPGKLPRATMKQSYELEYGTDTLEIHKEQVGPNDRVMIIDDVLATGGTAHAVEQVAKKMGAEVVGHLFFMELTFLKGRSRLQAPTHSLIQI